MFGVWKVGIPKDTLIEILNKLDADADGFITVGEVKDLLERYAKDAKASFKSCIIRRKGRA